jgi:hypothetical protein
VEWNGVEWSGMESSGMEWSAVKWNGVELLGFEAGPKTKIKLNCVQRSSPYRAGNHSDSVIKPAS